MEGWCIRIMEVGWCMDGVVYGKCWGWCGASEGRVMHHRNMVHSREVVQ
jgi:hypothetical protein